MKKTATACILILLILSAAGTAFAKSLELKKRAADYSVEIKLDRNPPIVGDNEMEIYIKDARGEFLKGPGPAVNYYMLPMPRMAPMNYTIPAKPYKHYYRISMNFIMSGPWVIAIKIPADGRTRTIKFNIDVQ
ncbi:MAG: FixH family protein [Deltaproteobacteria bacterium]